MTEYWQPPANEQLWAVDELTDSAYVIVFDGCAMCQYERSLDVKIKIGFSVAAAMPVVAQVAVTLVELSTVTDEAATPPKVALAMKLPSVGKLVPVNVIVSPLSAELVTGYSTDCE